MQNLTPYFDFPPPHCLFTMILLGGSKEDLRVFTSETSNAKAKSSENFLSPDEKWPNFGGFGGMGVRWYKDFQVLLQKAHPCPNLRRLSHFAWRSVEGSDPQRSPWKKKSESHRTSHWNDVSPLTQGCTIVRLWSISYLFIVVFYFAFIWLRNIAICVCMSVYMQACVRNHMRKSHSSFDACCLWPWLGPSPVTLRCLCTSGFVDDVAKRT